MGTIIKCDLTLDKDQFNKYTEFLVWLKKDRELKVSEEKCPNCNQLWNGIECDHCSFDTGFDPYWD